MTDTAAQVPSKFDVVIDGHGYIYHDAFTGGNSSNVPEKAVYTYTPTFIQRQNTQGDYGDNQQDFWLTFSQKDWSLGEGQRHESRVADGQRRYWVGTNVDVTSNIGQINIREAPTLVTTASAANSVCALVVGGTQNSSGIALSGSTNLWIANTSGTTNIGAHGVGAQPGTWGLAYDGTNLYLTTLSAGTVGIRKWTGTGFSTWSASGADAIAYHNNALYGLRFANGDLNTWDTGGTRTALFTWKDAAGTAVPLGNAGSAAQSKVFPFGGKLAILRTPVPGTNESKMNSEVWIYDGQGVSMIWKLPSGFKAFDAIESNGIILVSGVERGRAAASSSTTLYPSIYYYSNGTTGRVWISRSSSTVAPALCSWGNGFLFTDDGRSALMHYDIGFGCVETISDGVGNGDTSGFGVVMAATSEEALVARGSTSSYLYTGTGARATSATITSSLADFNSSLTKVFRGVKVEFDSASDGNGGSVDIAYRVGDVDGSYTTLQTGATSGTEYNLSSISGRSISIKVTLNKGTSTGGPALKRIYVRAVPVQSTFRFEKYVLNCTGRAEPGVNDPQYIELHDGSTHNLDGLEMATNLRSSYTLGTTISITDKFGTFTGIIEELKLTETRPNEFVSEVTVREV